VASHIVGDRLAQMLQMTFEGDVPSARKIHDELSPVFAMLFITSNPIPLKAALQLSGLPAGDPRLPLLPATPDERDRIRRVMEDAGLL
jgi:4-hydroxy-tetrahydrodipicolinate synthase